MIHLARPGDVKREADRLDFWREATYRRVEEQESALRRAAREFTAPPVGGIRPVGGGAPQVPMTLGVIVNASPVNSTFTTAQSIITASATPGPALTGPVGPFLVDFFKTPGATWDQEAMGIISTTATPTIAIGTYFGVAIGTITTVLCITPTITTASGLANINWYWKALGRTITASGTTSTSLVTGLLFGDIEVLAATVAGEPIQYAVNATPPTAVTTDFSTQVFIDLKATWGASSASNIITTNFYALTSRYS